MASKEDDKKLSRIPSNITKLAKAVELNINKLYRNTYFTTNDNSRDLENIKNSIDRSIDNIVTNNLNNIGLPNISKLYTRAKDEQKNKSTIRDVEAMFDDRALMDSIMSTYVQNTYLKDLDNEIDTVCKYMPKLLEALDVRKDNVLSADHFTKDFINIKGDTNINNSSQFNEKLEYIKNAYDLADLFETSYDNAAKYGEQFIYIVPYKKALTKLMSAKASTSLAKMNLAEGKILMEGADPFSLSNINELKDIKLERNYSLNLEVSNTNMINSIVEDKVRTYKKLKYIRESSLNEADDSTLSRGLMNDLDYSDFEKNTQDGLIDANNKKEQELKIPGCIVKKIERANIIPIYIDELCLGYYYLEFQEIDDFNINIKMLDPIAGLSSGNLNKLASTDEDLKRDKLLRYISGQLSSYIDTKFINNNQDLRKEIYMILKHNDLFNTPSTEKLKVTFLPPEDVVHIHFKRDPKTNRGISDLYRALLPSKLYSSLYVTNSIGIMTRGNDKRVYYVRQNIDTNISKLLLNTIDQIKRSNFGIRQIENMNNILNITGRFNDYIVPTGPNGESPIQFEVMQGQNIEIKTDLMNMLEEMAINSTDVPLDLIQARQSIDYAVQLTMTNSKFLRKVYNRQAKVQKFFSQIVTKIYNAEYEADDELRVQLPPPMFLNITNTNQIMDNVNQFVQSIVDGEMPNEQDDLKLTFGKNLRRYYLGTYLDYDTIEDIKKRSEHELAARKNKDDMQQQ